MHRKGYTHYMRGFICDYPFPRTGFHTPSSALLHSPILNRRFSFSTPSSSPQRYFDPRDQLGLPRCAFRIHLLDNKWPRWCWIRFLFVVLLSSSSYSFFSCCSLPLSYPLTNTFPPTAPCKPCRMQVYTLCPKRTQICNTTPSVGDLLARLFFSC